MKITQSFTVARPAPAVWAFLQDLPAVTQCLPGAELVESRAGMHRGKVAVALGPFKAAFEGEAKITADPAALSGQVEGRGVDKRGGSHSRIVVDYKVSDRQGATLVELDVDLVLSGPIAQFGRTGMILETAKVLIGEFAQNLEARISAPRPSAQEPAPKPPRISLFSLFFAAIGGWLRHLFYRTR
jgi:carbon-monoxide dehydrogenase small subunit